MKLSKNKYINEWRFRISGTQWMYLLKYKHSLIIFKTYWKQSSIVYIYRVRI